VRAGRGRAAGLTALLPALLPVLLLAACGHAAAPVPPPVTLSACGGGPQVRPGEVLVICFTNDITAQDLKWRAWGKPTASASGTALVDLCAYEDCHTGSYGTVPITLIASKLVRCPRGTRAYSTLRYVFTDGSPWPGIPANLNTSGYVAGPRRVLPPADQTVSLAC
jgi:hypothetical protein